MLRVLVLLAAVGGCRVTGVDLTGKACPCPGGWYCDSSTATCTRDLTSDAESADVASDAFIDPSHDGLLTYRDAVLADAPIAYWRLGDTGQTAHDEMGSYDGTYSGTCMFGVQGALANDSNTAVHFDGSTCVVTLPDQLAFLGTSSYSVEAWIEQPSSVVGYRTIFSKESRSSGPVDGYALVDSSTGAYFERAVTPAAPTTMHATITGNQFVHLVGVYDGTKMMMYVDGTAGPALSDTVSMPTYSAVALIGADLSGDNFIGALDEVAVYDHVLSAARVTVHHELGVSGP